MATQVYEKEVLEVRFNSILDTELDITNYFTVDNTLAENDGMKKTVVVYTATGSVEDVAEGEGNTVDIEMGNTSEEYEVVTTQGRFPYTDEQAMIEPAIVDKGLGFIAEKLVNDLVSKTFTEFGKATLGVTYPKDGNISFETVVDAIAKLNKEKETGLFMLINPSLQAGLRKELKDSLVYVEAYVRSGYIGSVCGVPVYISKAVPAKTAFIATQKAVTCYVKKNSTVATERVENTRTNYIYGRKVAGSVLEF